MRLSILSGNIELTVDDPAYLLQLADNRKFEIKEWLIRRIAHSQITKQDFDKKMQMLEEAEASGELESLEGTNALRVCFGMIEGEVALMAADRDQAAGS